MMASGQAQNQAQVVMVVDSEEDFAELLSKGDSIIPMLRELEVLQEAVLRRENIILDANFVTDLGLCSVFDNLMVCFVRSKLTSCH